MTTVFKLKTQNVLMKSSSGGLFMQIMFELGILIVSALKPFIFNRVTNYSHPRINDTEEIFSGIIHNINNLENP